MNDAQLKGIRMTAADHAMGAAYDASRLTISKTPPAFADFLIELASLATVQKGD